MKFFTLECCWRVFGSAGGFLHFLFDISMHMCMASGQGLFQLRLGSERGLYKCLCGVYELC